jgi:hypothetical protein
MLATAKFLTKPGSAFYACPPQAGSMFGVLCPLHQNRQLEIGLLGLLSDE